MWNTLLIVIKAHAFRTFAIFVGIANFVVWFKVADLSWISWWVWIINCTVVFVQYLGTIVTIHYIVFIIACSSFVVVYPTKTVRTFTAGVTVAILIHRPVIRTFTVYRLTLWRSVRFKVTN